MFTGIIRHQGQLLSPQDWDFWQRGSQGTIMVQVFHESLAPQVGDSVAVNGICLTVTQWDPLNRQMSFFVGPETAKILRWVWPTWVKRGVHLEPSLRWGDPVGGHWVSGHVDHALQVKDVMPDGSCCWLKFELLPALRPFVLSKASVAINGVSLTIQKVCENSWQIMLIPETLKNTHLGRLQAGDYVCVEWDPMGKWVDHWLKQFMGQGNIAQKIEPSDPSGGIICSNP